MGALAELIAVAGMDVAQDEYDDLRTQLEEANTYFETGIKDDAERAGIDTRGLVGMAIVHTMVEQLATLQTTNARLTTELAGLREALEQIAANDPHNPGWRQERARLALDGPGGEKGE